MSTKIVYIGAGLDVRPIRFLTSKHFTSFIYIDSQPYTEFPNCIINNKQHEFSKKTKKMFIDNLYSKMNCLGFDFNVENFKDSNDSYMIHFKKNNCEVKYYMNTFFPEMISNDLIDELSTYDTLYISGYHPDNIILEWMKKPIHLICWGNSYMGKCNIDECCETCCVRYLYDNPSVLKKISYYEKKYVPSELESMDDLQRIEDTKFEIFLSNNED
jgi:hypothetical protein